MKHKRLLSLLLVLAMLVGLMQGMTFSVSAAGDGEVTVLDSAPTAVTVPQGVQYKLYMSDVFEDSEGHSMTYDFVSSNNGKMTKIVPDEDGKYYLSFTDPGLNKDEWDFTLKIKATCSGGASAIYTLNITLTEGSQGDENQYGYDETPKSTVKVYLTVSSDGVPLVAGDGTTLAHVAVEVPYFDLEGQELSGYYRYHTENGSGAYTDAVIVERPTALHLYLYALGVYYLGLTPEDVTTGSVQINGHEGNVGVMNMDGEVPYEDEKAALNITGSATSLYMQQFWGHDENLMYYRNHVYPLMSAGWGSTADYILLSDGDTIDVAMFTDWSFWNDGGAFTAFDKDDYTVTKGDALKVATVKYDTKSVADGGTETFDPISENLNLVLYARDENGGLYDSGAGIEKLEDSEEGNEFKIDTSNLDAGEYCLMARDTRTGGDARYAPATAIVTVSEDAKSCEHSETRSTFAAHEPKDGKFDQTVTCASCGEQIGETTEHLYGNVDGDGEVGFSDVMKINTIINGAAAEDWQMHAADVNADGEVNAVDSTLVTQVYLGSIAQTDFPLATDVTYASADPDEDGTAQHTVTIKNKETDTVISSTTEECTDTDSDDKCDKCGAALKTECAHENTETAFKKHDTVDGKFDEIVTCKDCEEVVSTTAHLYGDWNDDGSVDTSDTALIARYVNGKLTVEVTALQLFAADVNADSKVDTVDARMVSAVYLGNISQTKLPIETDVTYTPTTADKDGNAQHVVIVMNKGTDNEVTSFTETCIDADSDNKCDKCQAELKTECTHENTESTFQCHDPKDGKFDETVKCTDCGEQVGETVEHYYGDVDGNGTFVAGEFQVLIPIVRQGGTLPTAWQNFACDVNEDGKIDDDDIALISALGRNEIILPTRTERAYLYYKLDNGTEKHYVTISLPDYPDADLSAVYRLNEACTDADDDGRCDLCRHCTHKTTEVRDAKAATCTEAGYTGDTYCTVCSEKTAVGAEITMIDHADTNGDGKCDTCGKQLTEPVPTRKEGYPATSEDTVKTGMAYLLSDLQAGKIFQPVDGKTLNYKNYYYQRSTDGGETWGPMTDFSEALFGMTTIQLTELEEGTYTYRFYASHDGVNFSTDTWTLTLVVADKPILDFSFYVGKDYNGNYPIIKLYSVETDDKGNEIMGEELTDVFCYSDFTTTLPEGTEEYDPAQGILVNNYQMFYAELPSDRYMYRAFAKNADTGEYDIALGGMTLDLPTDTNVDGLTGGGKNIYLQCNSFYTTSRKTDNTYFTADEYHVRVDCPIMKCSTTMGDPYVKGSYTYYPTMLYAAGNACLYNSYFYPDIDGYIFTQNINQTFQAGYRAGTKSGTINTGVELTVTVPTDTTFGLYFQWNNFNTTEVAPDGDPDAAYADRWFVDEGGATKHATYFISKGNGNYTWRLSDDAHVTKSGWLSNLSASTEASFSFDDNAPTDKLSHDFSRLGTQTINRDEADIQVNLDPSGFKTLDGKTRVRAYRHWQLINSDAGNIMVEPDFEWHTINGLGGDAEIETVNGGNTTANWADITPGSEDSFIAVHYYSVDVGTASISTTDGVTTTKIDAGSHGGLYPATNPERVGVIVVGGTGVKHGTADADVDFNIAPGATTTRSMDWDYNYDTWYYNADDPELTFKVKATGSVDVTFGAVAFADNLEPEVLAWEGVQVDDKGEYHLDVSQVFTDRGNGKGGTVIIRMEDSTGVSYRLVRVAKVEIRATNVSHEGEPIMPGDQVKLSFDGMYRSVNKISGIFNPTDFKPTYYDANGNKYESKLGQYQKMDNATVTVTIPEDLTFADGEKTQKYSFTNGYTFGSMYSAANPFAFLYNMTDTGVGTNFNAVTVTYYLHHYANATVEVNRKVLYNVALNITDESGNALSGVTVTLTDGSKTYAAGENGCYSLGYGTYSYTLEKNGYVVTRGSFTLGSADAEKVIDGVLTIDTAKLPATGANPWDGKTATEPAKDDDVYQIGTAAELAWFAQQVNGGSTSINAKLTADIELTGYGWTPIGAKNYYGTFDGDGHVIKNLYVNSTSYPLGLFGYLSGGAVVRNLGVTGNVICTAKSNAQAGGIAGYMNSGATISQCFSTVNVTSAKYAGGIAGYTASGSAITDCYATGNIATTSANECYLGGICGSYFSYTNGATLTNCYATGTVTGTKGNASYIGGISPSNNAENYVNCYYLAGTLSGESAKYGVTGLGTAKTADELKALAETLGEAFAADTENINGGYPVLSWQAAETPAGILGDVDGDGTVDYVDAAMAYSYYKGKIPLTEKQLRLADVDGDGTVDYVDAAMIYSYYKGKLQAFSTNNQ